MLPFPLGFVFTQPLYEFFSVNFYFPLSQYLDITTSCKHCFSSPHNQRITGTYSLRKKCLYSLFFWSAFSRMRTEYGKISVSLRIQSKCGKMRTRKTPNTSTYHAVLTVSQVNLFNCHEHMTRILTFYLSFKRTWPGDQLLCKTFYVFPTQNQYFLYLYFHFSLPNMRV